MFGVVGNWFFLENEDVVLSFCPKWFYKGF